MNRATLVVFAVIVTVLFVFSGLAYRSISSQNIMVTDMALLIQQYKDTAAIPSAEGVDLNDIFNQNIPCDECSGDTYLNHEPDRPESQPVNL